MNLENVNCEGVAESGCIPSDAYQEDRGFRERSRQCPETGGLLISNNITAWLTSMFPAIYVDQSDWELFYYSGYGDELDATVCALTPAE